jgi:SNF2 family DNA or RNA helicase
MRYEPKRHQQIAADFMARNPRSALFLDMGLGKTVVTLTTINRLIYEDFAADRALVIAPKRVAESTWTDEAAKWDHLKNMRVVRVLGTQKQRIAALETPADVYVINRENVEWLAEYLGAKWNFDIVVIDELSSFKSAKAKRWKALRKVIFTAAYVYGLTGTPAGNGYLDLWPEIYLLDRGERLGRTLGEYRSTYFSAGAHKGYVVFDWRLKRGAKERIDAKLSDICLSMSKEDWLDMPERTYNTIPVTLDRTGRKLYNRFQQDHILPVVRKARELAVADGLEDCDSAVVADMAAVLSGKLLQMANGAVYDDEKNVLHIHDAKLDALDEIRDVSAGQPLLVFYTYKHDLARIEARFPDAHELRGPEDIEAWNRGEIPMLLCHPASAGHGLNLQFGGHIIVWFGLPWSLEQYQQANDRLHRMGQTEPVIVHHLVAVDTLDERVMAALTDKDATQRGLLDALKSYVKEEIK